MEVDAGQVPLSHGGHNLYLLPSKDTRHPIQPIVVLASHHLSSMSDFDHDLYGDLDLEDLDATQLDDELVDPDLENADASAPAAKDEVGKPGDAQDNAPAQSQPAQQPPQQQQYGFDAHQASFAADRPRPSDVPDEGLVDTVWQVGPNTIVPIDTDTTYYYYYPSIRSMYLSTSPWLHYPLGSDLAL